ncbi:hypothetical protein ACFVHB_09700 [Kitasatospora sp. NPDC127111]|uniref:hypothetical protein n=1 Tax=Kitasatospora sp. NPDC127111 TaxID=3345363 RepID=UPI003627138C
MRDRDRGALPLPVRLLLTTAGAALCVLAPLAVVHTLSRMGGAAGFSGASGTFTRGICAPAGEAAPSGCPGRFVPDQGVDPVYTFRLDGGGRGRGPLDVRCAGGVCRPAGQGPVVRWLALTFAVLAALPVGLYLAVLGLGRERARRWLVGRVIVTAGGLLLAAVILGIRAGQLIGRGG